MNLVSLKNLTCLIPLYRSKQFISIIEKNIEEHLRLGARVLVSDKHGFDETADILRLRYEGNINVRVYKSNDQGDWVDNINFLMSKASSNYARIIPHDDSASGESSALLVESLITNQDAVMASGIVKAFDLEGNPIENRDELNEDESAENKQWSFKDQMEFFWTGRFNGSFKGVFNLQLVKDKGLFIKKTPTLVHSERLWLTALAFAGRFQFEPESILIKRYYESSTHAKWNRKPFMFLDSAKVLCQYANELFNDPDVLEKAKFIINYNAISKARFQENRIGKPPVFKMVYPRLKETMVSESMPS